MRRQLPLAALAILVVAMDYGCKRNVATTQTTAPAPPDVAFCDVVAKPVEYDGKIIRLHANFSFGIHGATVGDGGCDTVNNITWVKLSQAKWDELSRAAETAYGVKHVGAFDLVTVGKFSRNHPSGESDAWKDRAPFQFEVLTVERVIPPS